MKLTRKNAKILNSAIEVWVKEQQLSYDQGQTLLKSIEVVGFDWKRLAKYSFWVAIICIVISVGSILADDYLMRLLANLFNAPDIAKSIFAAMVSALLYSYGIKRKYKIPEKVFSNEALFFLGVLATAGSIAFLGRAIDTGAGHFSLLILLAAIVYGLLGWWFSSKMIWIFSLLSMGSWLGTETGYMSGWGAYYLGMNYPLRFVLFGLVLTSSSAVFKGWSIRRDFLAPTRIMGLLYLFIALWIMSIFGNYGSIDQWETARQIELFHWSLAFGLAAVAAIYHGIKQDDGMTRGFGIVFLFINLYTRFFEYFWDNVHKAVFFIILAASFWYLGSRAEKIWNIGLKEGKNE